jgi:GGDEF domain-containing protein
MATGVKPWERSAVVRLQAAARVPVRDVFDDPDPDTRSGLGDVRRALAGELSREDDSALLTRASLERLLDALLPSARQRRAAVGLVALHLEDWKELCERAGTGAFLVAFAAITRELRRRARSSDEIGRLGEAQIAMILPGCEPPDLSSVATRFRLALEGRELVAGDERTRLSAIGVELLACPRSGNPGAVELLAELEALLETARAAAVY